jgi:RHS repeat-associated protein
MPRFRVSLSLFFSRLSIIFRFLPSSRRIPLLQTAWFINHKFFWKNCFNQNSVGKIAAQIVLVFSIAGSARAQADPAGGIVPFSTQAPGIYESVDLASSNINMHIELRNKTGKLPFDYSLIMNSRAYGEPGCGLGCDPPARWVVTNVNGLNGTLSGGISLGATIGFTPTGVNVQCNGLGWSATADTNFYITDSVGTIHPLPIFTMWQNTPVGCEPTPGSAVTSDGSGYTLVPTAYTYTDLGFTLVSYYFTVYDKSGNASGYLGSAPAGTLVQDPDGASIVVNINSGTITDTLGTTAMTLSGRIPTSKFQYADAAGNTETFQMNYSAYTQQTVFGCQGQPQYTFKDVSPTTVELPSSVTTPTGNMVFTYEITPNDTHSPHYITGRLATITYPSGGSVTYSYSGGNNGVNCNSSVVPTLTKTVNDNNGHVSTWTYVNTNANVYTYTHTNNPYTVTVTDPANNQTVYTFLGEFQTQAKYYQGPATGTPLKTVVTCYSGNNSSQSACISPPNGVGNLNQTDVYTYMGSSAPSLVETKYDTHQNVTEVNNYDFGATYPPSGSPISSTDITYDGVVNCGKLSVPIFNLPCSIVKSAFPAGTKQTIQQVNYTYNSTGHPIQTVTHGGAVALTSSATYASNGVETSTMDANGTTTQYSNGPGVGACNGILPVGTTYAKIGSVQMAISQTWDCNGGVPISITDENKNVTGYKYMNPATGVGDPFWRLIQTNYPDGGQTTTTYNDTATPSNIVTNQLINSGTSLTTQTNFDSLGRPVQTQLTSDPDGADYTDMSYDGLGRVLTRSNPHRSSALSTDGTTAYRYDALGRTCLEVPPDATAPPSTPVCPASSTGSVVTIYTSNCATVTDEAGKARKSCTDALGRLTQVLEDPNGAKYETDYAYDALNNVTGVTQMGGASSGSWRNRSFTYDGLSRLLSATNPESGTISYTYDNNGNLKTKKAPQPNQIGALTVTTSYNYDALNRLIGKSYAGMSTAGATYGYDGIAPSGCTPPAFVWSPNTGQLPTYQIGRRTSMCDASGATSWGYDPMGRLEIEQRVINGVNKNTVYEYTLGGQLLHTFYPSGNRVDFEVDAAGRNYGVVDEINNYVFGNVLFAPNGAVMQADYSPNSPAGFGGVQIYNFYNKRQQLAASYATWQKVLGGPGNFISKHCYDYHVNGGGTFGDDNFTCTFSNTSPADNGNIYQITNGIDGNRTQNFSYDSLNRINQAYTSGPNWGETYTIDAWGNLTNRGPVTGKTNYEPLNAPALSNNQLTGYSYDAAGNVLRDSMNNILTYDAENRIAQVGSNLTYVYDGDGKRVKKSSGTIYWSGTDGNALAESDLSGNINEEYIYFNGQRVARMDRPSGTVHYFVSDPLGSARIVADTTGVIGESDYYPYGGEIAITGNIGKFKFTGKERDAESGLDHFEFRSYSSTIGRWMSPDPSGLQYADFTNPQTLNLYSYVLNNSLIFTDPSGLYCYWDYGPSDDDPKDGGASKKDCLKQGGSWTDLLNPCKGADGCTTTTTNNPKPITLDDFLDYLHQWKAGTLANNIVYLQNSGWVADLRRAPGVNAGYNDYKSRGCTDSPQPFSPGHSAGATTNLVQAETGDFDMSSSTSGNSVTFTVTNTSGQASWSGANATGGKGIPGLRSDGTKDNPYGPNGPRHNVNQTFVWSEPVPCQGGQSK